MLLVAILAASTAAGQTLDVAGGVGHVLIAHDHVRLNLRGVIVPDGQYGNVIQGDIRGRGPIVGLTVRGGVIDCRGLSSVTTALNLATTGLASAAVEDLHIRGVARAGMAISNGGRLTARGVHIDGDSGGFFVAPGSTLTEIRGCSVTGGKFGLGVVDVAPNDAGSIPGIDVDGLRLDMRCTQSPRFETVEASAISSDTVTCSHVLAHRSPNDTVRVLVPVATFDPDRTLRGKPIRAGDRVEADGAWSFIGPEEQLATWRAAGSMLHAEPSGLATVYRPCYGSVVGYGAGYITIRGGWRTERGEAMPVPELGAGVRVDVIRHGITGGPRDYDTGCAHITKAARGAVLRNVTARNGGSDLISVRGLDGILESCLASIGRDTGITVTAHHGAQRVVQCQAEHAGVNGFYVGGGASILERIVAIGNGYHGGANGWGIAIDPTPGKDDGRGSTITGTGRDNARGLSNLPELVKPVPATQRRAARPRARGWW